MKQGECQNNIETCIEKFSFLKWKRRTNTKNISENSSSK